MASLLTVSTIFSAEFNLNRFWFHWILVQSLYPSFPFWTLSKLLPPPSSSFLFVLNKLWSLLPIKVYDKEVYTYSLSPLTFLSAPLFLFPSGVHLCSGFDLKPRERWGGSEGLECMNTKSQFFFLLFFKGDQRYLRRDARITQYRK